MTLEESIKDAKMFVGQLEDELLSLVDTYKIGNPRKEGIINKIAGAKNALDGIDIEKPKPAPVKKEEPKVEEKKEETKKPKQSSQKSFVSSYSSKSKKSKK